jgi:hypothetical protein
MIRTYRLLGLLWILLLAGCASQRTQPSYSKQKDLIQPLLQTEFKNIIDSAPEGSRVGVDWCFDQRFDNRTVSAVSDWVQRQSVKIDWMGHLVINMINKTEFKFAPKIFTLDVSYSCDSWLSAINSVRTYYGYV